MATAPFVRKAVPGRTEREASSGSEQNHMRSLRMNTTRWIVPGIYHINILVRDLDSRLLGSHVVTAFSQDTLVFQNSFLLNTHNSIKHRACINGIPGTTDICLSRTTSSITSKRVKVAQSEDGKEAVYQLNLWPWKISATKIAFINGYFEMQMILELSIIII